MLSWPNLGTRVTLRYRRAAGLVPPLSDAVGHLLAVDPRVRVRTRTGAVVAVAPDDVVALRALTDQPVRTSEIRNLEYAAAAAASGGERHWHDGWLLRAGDPTAPIVNSALPLHISANLGAVPAIADWYTQRGLAPRLAIPDRLVRPPPPGDAEYTEQVLVRTLADVTAEHRAGERRAPAADAPDGTRWVGLSAVAADAELIVLGRALVDRGAAAGATHAYLRVPDTDGEPAAAPGFRLHHRCRYLLLPTR